MLKKLLLLFFIIISFNLNGCMSQNSNYINFSSKPSNHYYTDELKNKIISSKDFSLCVFDTNLYKDITVDKDENIIIDDFFNALNNSNYLSYDSKPENKEIFRITISFEDSSKYLIRIYDSSVIAVSPWDGIYEEDIVSMNDIPLRYNLLDFCTHIQNKPASRK